MKKSQRSRLPASPPHHEAGFTLIEVMVSVAILTIIGITLWASFAGGMDVMRKIPETGNTNLEILQLERAFRRYIGQISVPFWISSIEFNPDDDILEFPYLQGYADYKLLFYTEREYNSDETFLFIEGDADKMDEKLKTELKIENFKFKFGPFSKVSYEYVTDKDDNLQGATLSVNLMKDTYAEHTISLYANIGGVPFWKP